MLMPCGSRVTIIRPRSSRTEARTPESAGSCGMSWRWAPSRLPSRIVRNSVGSAKGVYILGGGRTGRDGIHGVTYASVDLTDKAVEGWEAGAVQLGDPILKEPLIQACVESAQAGLLDGLKDLGGGGLSCVIGEMALAGGFGAEVDLEKVPLKEEGLAPWEI